MERRSRAFASLNPFVTLAFLLLVIIFAMLVRNPAVLVLGLAGSAASYLDVSGRRGMRLVAFAVAVIPVAAVFNAFFNPRGATVLFEYLGGRHFTFEALALGASTGTMFATALLWFGCLSNIFTSDRFSSVFGRFMPAVSLVLSLSMRLVPYYWRKGSEMSEARMAMGKMPSGGVAHRVSESAAVASSLATWALESSIETADSMRSRGYGCARPTFYQQYPMRMPDIVVIAVAGILSVCVSVALTAGAFDIEYLPKVEPACFSPMLVWGAVAYAVLSILPVLVDAMEALLWRVYLSRI